jgi:hypothetical protein
LPLSVSAADRVFSQESEFPIQLNASAEHGLWELGSQGNAGWMYCAHFWCVWSSVILRFYPLCVDSHTNKTGSYWSSVLPKDSVSFIFTHFVLKYVRKQNSLKLWILLPRPPE